MRDTKSILRFIFAKLSRSRRAVRSVCRSCEYLETTASSHAGLEKQSLSANRKVACLPPISESSGQLARWAIVAFIFGMTPALAQCPPGLTAQDITAPTDTTRTFIRKGAGEYGAARGRNTHTGVDILTRASYPDVDAYAVRAMADGTVAYAQFNGGNLDQGFGNVVAIDHGNDCYTLFAHLASSPFTPLPEEPSAALMVKVGDPVKKGDVIGYFVDHASGVHSTGNAMRTTAGARWQTHVEFINASSGRRGPGGIGDVLLSGGGLRVDPTATLLDLGYAIAPEG